MIIITITIIIIIIQRPSRLRNRVQCRQSIRWCKYEPVDAGIHPRSARPEFNRSKGNCAHGELSLRYAAAETKRHWRQGRNRRSGEENSVRQGKPLSELSGSFSNRRREVGKTRTKAKTPPPPPPPLYFPNQKQVKRELEDSRREVAQLNVRIETMRAEHKRISQDLQRQVSSLNTQYTKMVSLETQYKVNIWLLSLINSPSDRPFVRSFLPTAQPAHHIKLFLIWFYCFLFHFKSTRSRDTRER